MVPGIDYVFSAVGKLFAVTILMLTACSGSTAPAPDPVVSNRDDTALREAQDAACHRVAPKVTDCAIESARANMPPDEFAEMARDLDETSARHSEQYIRSCKAAAMSRRQIAIYDQCPLDVSCEQFLSCTDRATPLR
jgi:hypothetical protein